MKMNKRGTVIRLFAAAVIFVFIPMAVSAMGNSEKTYGAALDERFTELAEAVESGEIDMKTAVDELNRLRVENNRPESPDYGEMERLLTKIMDRQMTALQAREQSRLLEECSVEEPAKMIQNRDQNKNTVRVMEQKAQPEPAAGGGSGESSGGNSGSSQGKANSGSPAKGKG